MIKQAMEKGEIGPNTVVIESSSGNLGIGLAQVCQFVLFALSIPRQRNKTLTLLKSMVPKLK